MTPEAGLDASALAATVRTELTSMRAEFHRFVDLLEEADLPRPTRNPAWSVGEQLMHIVFWLHYTPTAVQLVRRRTSVRSRLSRAIPPSLFDRLNILLTRRAAWHQTRPTIAHRYERAYQATLQALEGVRPEEWTVGAPFAAFGGDERTMATIFRSLATHQAEHLDEIRRSLAR